MEAVTRTGCCEPFDATPWQGTMVHWQDKPFIRADVRAVWHVPVGLGETVTRTMEAIRAAGAFVPGMKMIAMAKSPWRTEIYFETSGPVPGFPLERMTGTFFSRAFDGPWRDAGTWHETLDREAKERGLELEKVYEMWTTCPACAKAYGHNWVVLLGQLHEAHRDESAGAQPVA